MEDCAQSASRWRTYIVPVLIIGSILIMLAPTPTVVTEDGSSLPMRPEAQRLVAIVFLMAGLWLTQIVPLAATSLLPLALFPLLGIQSAESVSAGFVDDMLFLFIGGFIIALGIERWNLHRRIALWIVNRAGVAPKQLVLGMMLATALLSMWISNTATTLMMLPIALALLKITSDVAGSDGTESSERISERLTAPMLLGIAYAASIGGMTTIVGTPTNTTAVGIYQDHLPAAPEISIAQWMIVSVPVGIVYMAIVWLVLTWRLPRRSGAADQLQQELKSRLERLGPISRAEGRMMMIFAATGLLWIFRRPLEFGSVQLLPGWSEGLPLWFSGLGRSSEVGTDITKYANDSTVAILIAVLMFFIPSGTRDDAGRRVALMNWQTAVRLPWEIVLLFGGGLALAGAFGDDVTGLAGWMGQALEGPLRDQPLWLVIASLCLMMTFLTEVTSNVATISTMLPTVLVISEQLETDARLLLIPTTLATSCAFMLPIATAPNAIVFGSGRLTAGQMARYGFFLNLVGIPLLTAAAVWFIRPLLGID